MRRRHNDLTNLGGIEHGTRDQKEAFLKALGLFEAGDKYLDGIEVAEKLGVKIDRDTSKVRHRPLSKRLLGLT